MKRIALILSAGVLLLAPIYWVNAQYTQGQGPYPQPPGGVISNITVISNLQTLVVSNVTVQQNINVSGKATFNNITVTNQLQFTTNAFPLAAGTKWDLSKPKQFITTNADWVIGSLGGLTNYLDNWGALAWSNSDSAVHFCDLTALSITPIGTAATNKLYLAAGKMAVFSIDCWGIGVFTNLVIAVQP